MKLQVSIMARHVANPVAVTYSIAYLHRALPVANPCAIIAGIEISICILTLFKDQLSTRPLYQSVEDDHMPEGDVHTDKSMRLLLASYFLASVCEYGILGMFVNYLYLSDEPMVPALAYAMTEFAFCVFINHQGIRSHERYTNHTTVFLMFLVIMLTTLQYTQTFGVPYIVIASITYVFISYYAESPFINSIQADQTLDVIYLHSLLYVASVFTAILLYSSGYLVYCVSITMFLSFICYTWGRKSKQIEDMSMTTIPVTYATDRIAVWQDL